MAPSAGSSSPTLHAHVIVHEAARGPVVGSLQHGTDRHCAPCYWVVLDAEEARIRVGEQLRDARIAARTRTCANAEFVLG